MDIKQITGQEWTTGVLAEADAHLFILVLVHGKVQDRPYWAYARIPPSRYLAFREAERQGGYNLSDFADEILAHGPGNEPPSHMAEEMRKKGYDPGFEREFRDLLEKAAEALKRPGEE